MKKKQKPLFQLFKNKELVAEIYQDDGGKTVTLAGIGVSAGNHFRWGWEWFRSVQSAKRYYYNWVRPEKNKWVKL